MTLQVDRPTTEVGMTAEQRADFERDGYIIVRQALSADEVARARAGMEKAYELAERNGELDKYKALHQLSAVSGCPEVAFLVDHPAVFPLVWSILGWNLHIYHSHIDVHPPRTEPSPIYWGWHQDGGRQNREIETDPRARLSVKLAFWFSDVTETGRGNLMVIPGSHKTNWLPGPPSRGVEWEAPADAIEVQVGPGDVVFFDRRIWHQRSNNYSDITRMAAFFGYTHRWIAGRDEVTAEHRAADWWAELNPVQQQLLGGTGEESGDDRWGHYPQTNALYCSIREQGGLDRSFPPLIPDGPDL